MLCLITRNPETGVLVVRNGDTCNNNFQIILCVERGGRYMGEGGDRKGQVMEVGCQTTLSVSIVSSPHSSDKDIKKKKKIEIQPPSVTESPPVSNQ